MQQGFFRCARALALISLIQACASPTVVQRDSPLRSEASSSRPPCWLTQPDCLAKAPRDWLYFVGQSDQPVASWGQPSRASMRAAQQDAETQYARYLSVHVKGRLSLRRTDSHTDFEQTVNSTVSQTIGELVKADEYSVAHAQTEEGEPLWTVYVLMKIRRDTVEENQKKAAAAAHESPQNDESDEKWVVSVFNIDDAVELSVNGQRVNECGFSRRCQVELNPHLRRGDNAVKLVYKNHLGTWSYGYTIKKNDQVMYEGQCGQVWLYGCGIWNVKTGDVHEFDFIVRMP